MSALHNPDSLDRSHGKVYVNPNFNRTYGINNRLTPNHAAMHVNPRFSHLITNVSHSTSNNTRIYVNPNFMKTKSKISDTSSANATVHKEFTVPKILSEPNSSNVFPYNTSFSTRIEPVTQPLTVTKSRYSLVRQNQTNLPEKVITEQSKSTFKINKYKSVPMKVIKQNLETVKSTHIPTKRCEFGVENQYDSKINVSASKPYEIDNRFKLINHTNTSLVLNNMAKPKPIVGSKEVIHKRRIGKFNLRIMKKVKKGHLKKNNIPCPLYRKFGKCLRSITGKCDFLHDKRHVRVCRKFVKGICHDNECLLSHDLTKQKMPTCRFYLQGTCFKEDCPYLHVKLNANAKLCPEFLKGYCEKGSKCLNRHINVQVQNQVTCRFKKYSKTNNKLSEGHKVIEIKEANHTQTANPKAETFTESKDTVEYRYYQENSKDSSVNEISYEVIKPTRCKLGTLPSFIQL